MIKNSFKFIVLIILVIITSACSSNSNSFWGFKPHFSTGTYIDAYAIIENGKINRMGIPKKDIDKMDSIINDKYGIQFIDDDRIYALKGSGENYKIKFYNDFKMTVNGKEYVISKEKIRYSAYDYDLELPIKITNTITPRIVVNQTTPSLFKNIFTILAKIIVIRPTVAILPNFVKSSFVT